jgi:hypothetical protein
MALLKGNAVIIDPWPTHVGGGGPHTSAFPSRRAFLPPSFPYGEESARLAQIILLCGVGTVKSFLMGWKAFAGAGPNDCKSCTGDAPGPALLHFPTISLESSRRTHSLSEAS